MPEVNGRDILVKLDLTSPTGTTFTTVVCLTSNAITNTVTSLDGSSKCGNSFVPGKKFEGSVSGEGYLLDPDTGTPSNIGYPELYTAFVNRTIANAFFGYASANTGQSNYSGPAYITNLELNAPDDELVTFTFEMVAATPPFTQTIIY